MCRDLSDTRVPRFLDDVNPSDPVADDLGPESMVFIPATPGGRPLLLVANEASGTVTVFAVRE